MYIVHVCTYGACYVYHYVHVHVVGLHYFCQHN